MELKHVNAEQFEEAINSGDKVLVDFFATWCGPCKFIGPVLEELADELEAGRQIIKVDIDQLPQVANQYMVTAVPTMVMFKDGAETGRLVGVHDEDAIMALFN